MKEGFYFVQQSPDPFGKEGAVFLWHRVVHKHPAGQETIILDFLGTVAAHGIARQFNLSSA